MERGVTYAHSRRAETASACSIGPQPFAAFEATVPRCVWRLVRALRYAGSVSMRCRTPHSAAVSLVTASLRTGTCAVRDTERGRSRGAAFPYRCDSSPTDTRPGRRRRIRLEAAKAAFRRSGFVVLEGLLNEAHLTALRDECRCASPFPPSYCPSSKTGEHGWKIVVDRWCLWWRELSGVFALHWTVTRSFSLATTVQSC
jgi:hypothetical protein